MPYEQLVGELKLARSPTERRLHFAAILAGAGGVSADEFIVVGGSAIEFYTSGQYTSGDIDIVATVPAKWKGILKGWGFKEQGRIWFSDDLGIVVDFVKGPYTFDVTRTQVLTTSRGSIRIAALEDLLVKRLMSAKFWRIPSDAEDAKLLAVLYRQRIDWTYVERLAAEKEVADFLAALRRALSKVRE